MKFIHLSHVRFGETPQAFPGIDRTAEYEEDLMKVIRTCNEQNVEALFVTGNLFSHVPSEEELEKADELFCHLAVTRVFWVLGPEEAPGDPSEFRFNFKSRTTVFTGDSLQRVYLPGCQAEISGVGYSQKTWEKVRPEDFKPGRKGTIQILLLPFIGDRENTDALKSLSLPFDYVGLGQKLLYKGSKVLAPGVFEPEGFTQQIGHGYFLCTLNVGKKKEVSLIRQFVQCISREYISVKANLTRDLSFEGVFEQLKQTVRTYGSQNVYEIVLEGEMSPSVFVGKERLKEIGLVAQIEDHTDTEKMLEDFRTLHQDDALGRFMAEVFPEGKGDRLTTMAFEYGLKALERVKA